MTARGLPASTLPAGKTHDTPSVRPSPGKTGSLQSQRLARDHFGNSFTPGSFQCPLGAWPPDTQA